MQKWITLLALLVLAPWASADFQEGVQYQRIPHAQPTSSGDRIEVLELFWYGCPHCYDLEPELAAWASKQPGDVAFVRVPAILGPSWELMARGYYTAELLGVLDQIHQPLFERMHKQKKPIRTPAELRDFFIQQGVSAEDFDNTFASFAVVTKTNRARQAPRMYGISGVPALVVNGKYLATARLAGGNAKMLEVVDYLIEQERGNTDAAGSAAENSVAIQ
jgi:thiol:disulfide interchange protein DsbA